MANWQRGAVRTLACVWAWSAASVALADELRLKNGDVLHGTITSADAATITFTHALGTELVLPWEQIQTLASDGEQTVRLTDGSILKGTLAALATEAGFTLTSPTVGELSPIALTHIAGFGPVPPPAVEWDGTARIGITVTDGNTRSRTCFASLDATRASPLDLIEARAAYNYGDSRGVASTRNGNASLQYNYLLLDPGYLYVRGAAEYDRFKFLNLRTRVGVGVGMVWLDTDVVKLRTEVGVDYVNEDLRNQPDQRFPAGRGAATFRWTIVPGVTFRQFAEIMPNLEKGRDFVVHSETSLQASVGGGFAVGASVIIDYDEIPPLGARHRADTTYIGTLSYNF